MSSLRSGFMGPRSYFARGIVPRLGASVEPLDEARHGFDHHLGLVPVRRMAAIREAQQLDRPTGLPGDRIELGHGAVLVVEALDRQHRAAYAGEDLLYVPGAEIRVQPDVVPAPERLRRVRVVAAELLRQVGALERRLRLGDALHADVLDEYVGRHQD